MSIGIILISPLPFYIVLMLMELYVILKMLVAQENI